MEDLIAYRDFLLAATQRSSFSGDVSSCCVQFLDRSSFFVDGYPVFMTNVCSFIVYCFDDFAFSQESSYRV